MRDASLDCIVAVGESSTVRLSCWWLVADLYNIVTVAILHFDDVLNSIFDLCGKDVLVLNAQQRHREGTYLLYGCYNSPYCRQQLASDRVGFAVNNTFYNVLLNPRQLFIISHIYLP